MARPPRNTPVGYPQHVTQRGNNRDRIFFDATDRWNYLECIRSAMERYGCDVHAYVLMTNHTHLLVTPRREKGLSNAMQIAGSRYARYINRRYERTGTLWEGRFKASLVDTDGYFLACMRYIEQNPVRAGFVAHPAEHEWSSVRGNVRGEPDPILTPHPVYLALGRGRAARLEAYRRLLESALGEETIDRFRRAIDGGWPVGEEDDPRRVERAPARRAQPAPRGGDRRSKHFLTSQID